MDVAIETTDLTREYRVLRAQAGIRSKLRSMFRPDYDTIVAVNRLNLNVPPGETVGFIGTNGSGKSTTIKLLCGILKPTTGHVRVLGVDPFKHRRKNAEKVSAIIGQKSQLWQELPVADSFEMIRLIYNVPRGVYDQNLDRLTKLLDLRGLLPRPARELSLGQRMRCDIAAGLLHGPKIMYLDEPTLGLDFAAKRDVYSFIREIKAETGVTIFITSHDLADVEECADRIIVMDRGNKLFDDSRRKFMLLLGGDRIIEIKGLRLESSMLPSAWRVITKSNSHIQAIIPDVGFTNFEVFRHVVDIPGVVDVSIKAVTLSQVAEGLLSQNQLTGPAPIRLAASAGNGEPVTT